MATRKQYGKTAGRQIGTAQVRSPKHMTDFQKAWLSAMVVYCLGRDTAVFIGTPTTTGSIRVNVYPPDDKCVGSLSLLQDWDVEVPAMLSDIYEEEITAEDVKGAATWLTGRAAEAPRDVKPTLRPSESVEVPRRPARLVTEA